MIIGLPKAFMFYRYRYLWEIFFQELGFETITSEDTCQSILTNGIKNSIDENCLPLKAFMGHVHWLLGRCDYILVPRFVSFARNEEFCIRFFGLYDLVQNTFKEAKLLTYNLDQQRHKSELRGFMKMGRTLGKNPVQILKAYRTALAAQARQDKKALDAQQKLLDGPGLKILLAAQPYLIHDPYLSGSIPKMIAANGGIPLYSDRCDRELSRKRSKEITHDLYWTIKKEGIGSIVSYKNKVAGIILLSAFPCGTDALANELVMRKVKDIPMIQIVLDEHQAEAGLQTRIESFMDILQQRSAL